MDAKAVDEQDGVSSCGHVPDATQVGRLAAARGKVIEVGGVVRGLTPCCPRQAAVFDRLGDALILAYEEIRDKLEAAGWAGQCCVMNGGDQCPAPARFWVGAGDPDDYTHVCGDHVELVKRDGDTVHKLGPAHAA